MRLVATVRRLLGTPARPAPRARPGVEPLEGREVPAVLTWTGAVSTTFGLAENWRVGGDVATRPPEAGDELVFDASAVNPDCDGVRGFGSAGADYEAVRLLAGYQGTVTLAPPAGGVTTYGYPFGRPVPNARFPHGTPTRLKSVVTSAGEGGRGLTVGALELRGGAIAQPGDRTELTVLTSFDWTGGVLGGTTAGEVSHSAVYVRGGAATLAPGAETLTLGSTLHFDASAGTVSATAHPGTIDLLGGDGVVVGAGATFAVSAPVPEATLYMRNVLSRNTAVWNVRRGGFFEVIGPGVFDSDRLPMVVSDGAKFRVSGGATAAFGGQVPGAPGPDKPSVLVDGAAVGVEIENGGTLKATSGVELRGGYLKTFRAAGESAATIDGDLWNHGAAVYVSEVPGFVYSTPGVGRLNVTGNVKWTAGAYHADVDATSAAGDLWYCAGTFEVGAGVSVVPGVLDGSTGGPSAGRTWLSVEAGVGITGSVPAVPSGWEVVANAGPTAKKWYLRVS